MGRSSLPVILFYMLVSSLISQSTVFSFHFRNKELFEGDQCPLSNDGQGVCKKLKDCPQQLENYHKRPLEVIMQERCGFEGITEIVCCPVALMGTSNNNSQIFSPNWPLGGLPVVPFPGESYTSSDGQTVDTEIRAEENVCSYLAIIGFRSENPTTEGPPISYLCGGSLISPRHVLTIARCIVMTNNLLDHVLLGTTNNNFLRPGDYVQRILIQHAVTHPEYKQDSINNNLAILIMESDASITSFVKPIRIHGISANSMEDTKLKVAEFTDTGHESTIKKLTKYDIKIVRQDECESIYRNALGMQNVIDETLICGTTLNRRSTQSSCSDGYGFPLILTNTHETDPEVLVGVTIGCFNNFPMIYTAVFPYIDWINELVWMK